MKLHRLSLPLPLRLNQLNAYLIRGRQGLALVDTGMAYPEGRQALEAALEEQGVGPTDLQQLFVTHFHGDHWGQAGWLREQGVKVLMPAIDSELLQAWFTHTEWDRLSVEAYRPQGVPEAVLRRATAALRRMRELSPRFQPDQTVVDEEIISLAGEPFRVLITPGHSPGHGCLLHEPSRTLLCGDHVLPQITPNISRELGSASNPLADYRASLRRVRSLEVSTAWPAHGEPMDDLRGRIDELLRHHEEREELLLGSLGEQALTTYQVAGHLFQLERLDGWETWMALGETSAHLAALLAEGRLEVLTDEGVERYRRSGG